LKAIKKKLLTLKPVENEAEYFAQVIKSTAALAEGVSQKVKQLDKAKVTLENKIFACICFKCFVIFISSMTY